MTGTVSYRRKSKPAYTQRAPTFADALAKMERETNALRRKLLFMGYLTQRLEKEGVNCIIVGGEAVEVYTAGQFTTGDIDIVVSSREKVEQLLAEMGFEQPGRVWINRPLNIAVDIVSSSLVEGGPHVRTVKVGGSKVKLAAVEDLIVERLVSAKYWGGRYQPDLEQATVLMVNFRGTLDWGYLERKVSEEKVEDLYQAISEKAKQIGSRQP